MSDLVKRLRIKAGMIEMGELIAWGSDTSLMREAADALEMAAPAVQVEPVGYVSPHLLKSLRSGKACGITMEDKPDVHNGVTIPLYAAPQPEVAVPEIIEAVANFVGSQKGGPFTPAVIKAAILGQLEYGDAFTKLFTPRPAEQQPAPDVAMMVEALCRVAHRKNTAGYKFSSDIAETEKERRSKRDAGALNDALADLHAKNRLLVEALELISDTDPDEETAWFHETADNALAAYRKQGGEA